MTRICEGLNVIEYGAGSIAGSIVGMVLADAGARVIKIEPPDGDRLRKENESGFLVWNRGKESLVADLRTSQGQRTLRELAAKADVAIEGFAPGVTKAWGVDGETLRKANDALVHLSITGFGETGTYSTVKAYDPLVAAKAGLWSRGGFGHREGPQMYPVNWASFGAGMQGVAGVMAALHVRETTGRGQLVKGTLFAGLDPLDYFVHNIVQLMAKRGEEPSGDSRTATSASRYGVLVATKDGRFIQTSTLLPHQGKALCEVAGIESCLTEPRFAKLPMFDDADDAQAWEDMLLEAFREQDLEYWVPRLEASPDVAFEIAATSEEGLDHPQIVHNGDSLTVNDPSLGPVRQVGPLFHSDATPMEPVASAPALNANNGPFADRTPIAAKGSAPQYPFAGITVVEFGYYYAMPFGVAMLASLGARVIKIEDGNGDPMRMSFGPEIGSTRTTARKESVSLDLSTPEGRKIAQEIIAKADLFVTGFRSNVAAKLGLGWDELSKINPRLVYVNAAGYGIDGPYANRALYAQAAQAVAGCFGRQTGYWAKPEVNVDMSVIELQAVVLPRLGQVVDGDSNAALAVLSGLSMALYHQQRTGKGQKMFTSMIAGNAWAYSDDFCTYKNKRPMLICDEEYYGIHALERVYPTKEGWVQLVVRNDREVHDFLSAVGKADLLNDLRFATPESRLNNTDALIAELEPVFASRTAAEWEASLSAEGIGCVECNMKGHAVVTAFDPHLLQDGLTMKYDHPLFGEMVRVSPPLTFSETPSRAEGNPCQRGEHNHKVLGELGYTTDQIAALEASGAVAAMAKK